MKYFFSCVLFLTFITVFGQTEFFSGFIKDSNTNDAIAYVNIGIVNKNSGTVSDTNGKFSIAIDDKFDNEVLKISIIGYQSISYKVSDFKKAIRSNEVIFLDKNISTLKEVVIKNRNLKHGILGNFLEGRTVSAGFVNNILGNEMGMVMKVKKSPTFIEGFHAIIDYNKYETLKFRLNFYEVKDGFPTASLLDENIIITSDVKKGRMNIDLSDYNIMVNGDFFVSLEWIEGLGEGGLHFLADYTGPPVITRAASQGKWNKQNNVSFGFTISVKH